MIILHQCVNIKSTLNLLTENIYFTVRKKDFNNYKVNLSKFNIEVKGKIFVAVENVELNVSSISKPDNKRSENKSYRVNVSGTLIGSKSFYRKVSLGDWEKIGSSISPGFWITYFKN